MTTSTYTPTHVITDANDNVLAVTPTSAEAEEYAIRAAVRLGRTAQVVEIATADVATLARIAATQAPAMLALGSGFLGAGTHPAQPYLAAMLGMTGVTERNASDIRLGYDSADEIIIRFLGNAKTTWRGSTARAAKARLREIAGLK
jgi:hypothetical protein